MSNALEELVHELAEPHVASEIAQTLGCRELPSAAIQIQTLATLGISPDLIGVLLKQLAQALPSSADPDLGLANLLRFIQASRSPQALLSLFERDPMAIPVLVKILATSGDWANQLVSDPESFDLLRMTEGLPVSRGVLVDEICTEVGLTFDSAQTSRILRSHKQRESMRISYGDVIGALPLEKVAEQLTVLAEAILEAAVAAAWRETLTKAGTPLRADGSRARFCVIGYGHLGGNELSYANELPLFFVADPVATVGTTRVSSTTDFFERMARRVVNLLSESIGGVVNYSVESTLRPGGVKGPLVTTVASAVWHYENLGRTWERLAFIKARPVAGDLDLGSELLGQLEPWIYRRYLTRADLGEIAALKRRIESRALEVGNDDRNIIERKGGLRDIEFLIQFLQLVSGGNQVELRSSNTLHAMIALEQTGWLTAQERSVLDDNYRFLRRLHHSLQIMFGGAQKALPEEPRKLRQYLLATGFRQESNEPAYGELETQLSERADRNRRILDHLLSSSFGDEGPAAEESDLVLDPAPIPHVVDRILARYGFLDTRSAYEQLISLGQENVTFLSSPRCRHFLSAIAPRLLQAISRTPAPDQTLETLVRVSESLGGKAVLWELFQSSQAAMDLCVRLCASSPYLVGILTSNPGMIDELIDSLMLDRLPTLNELEPLLSDMCRGVEEPGPILHSFKNSMHLRIGVRDVLGKDDIADTHRALSDVAETCLKQVIEHEYHRLVQKLGIPIVGGGPREGEPAELIVLAVGKLGGREPNYHSDLDVLFLYDSEGMTKGLLTHRRHVPTTNQNFFNQLSQRIVKSITRVGSSGHLYELDARLRPLGGSVSWAVTIEDWVRYFCEGPAQLWERQALCKARPLWADPAIIPALEEAVRKMQTSLPWLPQYAVEIRQHRSKLEEGAHPFNIKRGRGGTLDIEFIVQMLQLQHACDHPEILTPGTLDALRLMRRANLLDENHAVELSENYRALREIESALRLMNLTARHDLPSDKEDLDQLEFLLGSDSFEKHSADDSIHPVIQMCDTVRRRNREMFDTIFDANS